MSVLQLPIDSRAREVLRQEAQRYVDNYSTAARTILAYIRRELTLLAEVKNLACFEQSAKNGELLHLFRLAQQRRDYAEGPFCTAECSPSPSLRPYLHFEERKESADRWRQAKEREVTSQEQTVRLIERWKATNGPRNDAELSDWVDAYRDSLEGQAERHQIELLELLDVIRELLKSLSDTDAEKTDLTPDIATEHRLVAEIGPAHRCLSVDLAKRIITLDGNEYDVRSENALRWVKVLADHPGEWISSNSLTKHDEELDGVRTDKLKLPDEIAALIESQPGAGSRIRMDVSMP